MKFITQILHILACAKTYHTKIIIIFLLITLWYAICSIEGFSFNLDSEYPDTTPNITNLKKIIRGNFNARTCITDTINPAIKQSHYAA